MVQLTVRANGTLLRAEEKDPDWATAFDLALDKIERRIQRYKGRFDRKKRRMRLSQAMVADVEAESEEGTRRERPRTPGVDRRCGAGSWRRGSAPRDGAAGTQCEVGCGGEDSTANEFRQVARREESGRVASRYLLPVGCRATATQ